MRMKLFFILVASLSFVFEVKSSYLKESLTEGVIVSLDRKNAKVKDSWGQIHIVKRRSLNALKKVKLSQGLEVQFIQKIDLNLYKDIEFTENEIKTMSDDDLTKVVKGFQTFHLESSKIQKKSYEQISEPEVKSSYIPFKSILRSIVPEAKAKSRACQYWNICFYAGWASLENPRTNKCTPPWYSFVVNCSKVKAVGPVYERKHYCRRGDLVRCGPFLCQPGAMPGPQEVEGPLRSYSRDQVSLYHTFNFRKKRWNRGKKIKNGIGICMGTGKSREGIKALTVNCIKRCNFAKNQDRKLATLNFIWQNKSRFSAYTRAVKKRCKTRADYSFPCKKLLPHILSLDSIRTIDKKRRYACRAIRPVRGFQRNPNCSSYWIACRDIKKRGRPFVGFASPKMSKRIRTTKENDRFTYPFKIDSPNEVLDGPCGKPVDGKKKICLVEDAPRKIGAHIPWMKKKKKCNNYCQYQATCELPNDRVAKVTMNCRCKKGNKKLTISEINQCLNDDTIAIRPDDGRGGDPRIRRRSSNGRFTFAL